MNPAGLYTLNAKIRVLKAHVETLKKQKVSINEVADRRLEKVQAEIDQNEAKMAELDAKRVLEEIKKHEAKTGDRTVIDGLLRGEK